jgi:molybdate transport system ATP-binding protein
MVRPPLVDEKCSMIEIDVQKTFVNAPKGDRTQAEKGVVTIEAKFASEARILALFGKSGSGKSTIVNVIAGIVRADHGRATIDGETLFDVARGLHVPIAKRGVGYVFQDALLFPHLSVRKNLLYGAKRESNLSIESKLSFDAVIDLLGIRSLLDRMPRTLSGGEKQRVAIGRALLSNPRVLLMDEPLASLDQDRRGEILKLIERMRDELGVRIVYVSHSIAEVSRLADQVALMNEGKLIAFGDTETIFNRRDLRPFTGRYEGGALIEAEVVAHDATYFLSTLRFDGGELVVPGIDAPLGARVRARIRARDVSLAAVRPTGISIRNVLEGMITTIDGRGGAIVEVHVKLGNCELLSRISRQARDEMNLRLGQSVFVLVKAVAFDKRSIGFAGGVRNDNTPSPTNND